MRKLISVISEMSPIGAAWAGIVTGIPLAEGIQGVFAGEPMGRAIFFGVLQLLALLAATYLLHLMFKLL
jgi:hypothetical protein